MYDIKKNEKMIFKGVFWEGDWWEGNASHQWVNFFVICNRCHIS